MTYDNNNATKVTNGKRGNSETREALTAMFRACEEMDQDFVISRTADGFQTNGQTYQTAWEACQAIGF